MSYKLSNLSLQRLEGVDSRLEKIVNIAIHRTPIDFGIAWMGGLRTDEEQNELFKKGNSTKDGYVKKSKHQLGLAIDFMPYVNGKSNIKDRNNYLIIIGVFFAVASELGLKIRSGANWDRDQEFLTDQNFDDLPHIELDV